MFEQKGNTEKLLLSIVAENAARRAGEVLLRGFGTDIELTGPTSETSRSDISSVFDRISDEVLIQGLLEGLFCYERKENEVRVISEESGTSYAKRGEDFRSLNSSESDPATWKYSWVVDPLCGSIPYARGVADFIISVCLMEGDELKIGVVYDPVRDELFSAVKGMGALLNGKAIQPSSTTLEDFQEKRTYVSIEHKVFRNIPGNMTQDLCRKTGRIRVAGTCGLELCYVACGRVDALIKLKQPLYDYAAGVVILSEALGEKRGLTDLSGTTEISSSPEGETDLLASNGVIHSAISNMTRKWQPKT